MRYTDDFKFISPFFKDKSERIIDLWTTEMNEFALKVTAKHTVITLIEARMMWILYKMAEIEAININSKIAEEMQQDMLNQFK